MVCSSYASHSPPPLIDGATRLNSTLSVPKRTQSSTHRSQLSTSRTYVSMLWRSPLAHNSRREGIVAAHSCGRESAVRFRHFHPPLFFASNVVLSSHSFIGCPFPNDGYVSAALALGARVQSHPFDHYSRSLGAKAVLTLMLPSQLL
jgi:hypothetical protein